MKIFLLILLSVVFVLFLIGLTRVRVRVLYDSDGIKVFLKVFFLKIGIYPQNKKKVKVLRKPENKNSSLKKGGDFSKILQLLKLAKDIFGELRRKLHVDLLSLDIKIASSDPFRTAMFFGSSGTAAGVVLAILENLFIIKDKKISVNADFSATKTVAIMDVKLSLSVFELICLAYHVVYKYIKMQKPVNEN